MDLPAELLAALLERDPVDRGLGREASETTPDAFGGPERKLHPLAYGIERMGLVSLRFPYVVAVVLVVAAILAAFGVERIQVDDSLSQLFRSNTPEFKQYEDVTQALSLRASSMFSSLSKARPFCRAIRSASYAISSPICS